MTGLMVHIAPGTVSQILVGMLVTFVGFGIHVAAKPYKQMSNNILMIFGKFQLFLTLFGALLLKMETPFFGNDSQMRELDIKLLTYIIIYSTALLLVVWLATVIDDIYSHQKHIQEANQRRQKAIEGKRRFHLMQSKLHWVESVAHGHESPFKVNPKPSQKGKATKITPISEILKNSSTSKEKSKTFTPVSEILKNSSTPKERSEMFWYEGRGMKKQNLTVSVEEKPVTKTNEKTVSVEKTPVTKTNEKAEFSPNKAQKSTTQKDPQNARFNTKTENSSPPTSLNIDDIDKSKLRQVHHPHSHEKTKYF